MIGMAGFIAASDIGFCLRDAADKKFTIIAANQIFSKQILRNLYGIAVVKIFG
jgi:hypothetical protein